MSTVTVQQVKNQLALSHDDDDAYLQDCIDDAESRVETILGYPLSDLDPVPGDIKRAIKLAVVDYYNHIDGNTMNGADAKSGLSRLDAVLNSQLINHRRIN